MSAAVKLSSALAADDELNGLDALADDLIDDPKTVRVAVIWFDTVKVVEKTDDGTRVPYARIRRIEPLGNVDDVAPQLRDLIQAAIEQRNGTSPLPFDAAEAHEVEE